MGTRKHISVNLRDLQRVMNKEEDELPNSSSDKSKFGAAKNFEYKLSNNRWENEDNDDDFDIPNDRNPAPDFSALRRPVPRPVERKQPITPVNETSAAEDNWRSTDFTPSEDVGSSWRTAKSKEDTRNQGSEFKNAFSRSRNNNSDSHFDSRPDEPRKLYVPRFRREASPSPRNDRFSCLEDPRDNQSPTRGSAFRDSNPFSRSDHDRREERTRDDWGLDDNREDRFRNDRYRDEDRNRRPLSPDGVFGSRDSRRPADTDKKGLFVPSYRRNMKKEDTVEDIFMKAAGLTDTAKGAKADRLAQLEKTKKDKVNLAELDQELEKSRRDSEAEKLKREEAKKNEVANHNKLFKCSSETAAAVKQYVLALLKSEAPGELPDLDDESLVPAILTCVILSKNCERCKTLEEVHDNFKRAHKWLLHTTANKDTRKLLTELSKSLHHWGYPSLSESVYLVEALFDSLYSLDVVKKADFLKWFEDDLDEIPDRVTLLIQLMNWKKWLSGETLEEVAQESEEESDEDDDDSDIEANVPKPVRLTKGVKFK